MKKTNGAPKKYLQLINSRGVPAVLFLILLNATYVRESAAQTILHHEITLRDSYVSLEELLIDIERSSDVRFTYSIQKIDANQPVEFARKTATLARVLDQLLGPLAIKYQVFNNRNIVLSKQELMKAVTSGIALSGNIRNHAGEPIQFANVMLQESSDIDDLMKGAVSDELGRFLIDKIAPGLHRLTVSFIGFETIDTTLDIAETVDLGTIVMHEEVNTLTNVSVTARRRLIRQEIDRIILDIENSILAGRGNALDVLASTPGVSVQNDQINMIGKSTVGILVDDKLINLSPEEVANVLRTISSEDIMRIEVISNPSARYEAEGNSGLINIVLKKARRNSWYATIGTGYIKKTKKTGQISANLAYNKSKLSVASSLYFIDGKYYQEQDDYAYFPDGLWYTSSPILSDYRRINGRLDISYQLTPNWSVGSQIMRNSTDYVVTDNPYTSIHDNQTKALRRHLLSTFSQMNWKPRFNSVNLNSTVIVDTSGRNVRINLDRFRYKNEDIRQYIGESIIHNPYSKLHYAGLNTNLQAVENFSGAIDVDYPVSWGELAFGVKLARSLSTNDISYFNSGLVSEEVTSLPLDDNDFEYMENLEAAYVSVTRPISSKVKIQLGARVEATQTKSRSENLQLYETNDYVRVFPTLFFNYSPSEQTSYGLNYGRRINRPSFGELNPNIFFINPFQTIVGNAFLQPSYTDNFELTTTNGNLMSKVYYSREQDIFAQVPLPNKNNNIITFTNENYVHTRRYGLSEFLLIDKLSWWSSSNSFDINYSLSSFDLEMDHPDLKGFSSRMSTSNDFGIGKIEGLSINISYSYTFGGRNYIFNTGKASNLSGAIRYLLLDGRLKISLTANDLLKDSAERLEATVNGVYQTARYYYDARTINFSLSYSIGNNNISAKRHDTSNKEERNRTGN